MIEEGRYGAGHTVSEQCVPASQLTFPLCARRVSAKKVELIQGDGFGRLDRGMDTIHLDGKGLRVHLDFGRQPIAHHVPLRNRARAIHRHDLAFEVQLVRNAVVIGGT